VHTGFDFCAVQELARTLSLFRPMGFAVLEDLIKFFQGEKVMLIFHRLSSHASKFSRDFPEIKYAKCFATAWELSALHRPPSSF